MLVFRYNTADSTNSRAMALSQLNPGKRILVTAAVQTAGRGRTGRAWQSPLGGAWFSLTLPRVGPLEQVQAAPLVAGLAVHDTLCDLLPHDASQALKIKWPNDLLLHDCKIAGILCEQHLGPNPTVTVGVGINVNLDPDELNTQDLRRPATSLLEHLGRRVALSPLIDACTQRIITRFNRLLDSDAQQQLNERLAWCGQRIRVQHARADVIGEIVGIDPAGQLILNTHAGRWTCAAGEIESLTSTTLEPAAMTP